MESKIKILLQHILESIETLEAHLKGLSEEQFMADVLVQDGVEKRLANICEAVANLPNDFVMSNEQIPWRKISGLRNIIIHEYFGVDLVLIWNIAKQDIPVLKILLKIA